MTAKQRILIVEDDPLIGLDIRQTLTGFGYEVVDVLASGEEVLEKFGSLKPNAVLMDITLKGKLDGIDTSAEILKHHNVPIVFLTALSDEATLRRARLTKPYGYLIKPFDPSELNSTLQVTLDRFGSESAAVALEAKDAEDFEIGAGDLSDRRNALSEIQALREGPAGLIDALAHVSSIRSYEAGDFIFTEGSDSEGGFIVVSGRVNIMKVSPTGKELIVSLVAPGDIFGLFFLAQKLGEACSAYAPAGARMLWISRDAFLEIGKKFPGVYEVLNQALIDRLVNAYGLAGSIAHSRVEDRIVATILALLPQLGRGGKGDKEARLHLTRKELADLTGTTPETAIRVTKQLERDGYLDLTRPGIIKIVDIEKLKSLSSRNSERQE